MSTSKQHAIAALNQIFTNSHEKFSAEDFEQVFYQVADLQISFSDFIQALLETKKEISTIAEVNGYYSVNATCEIGMNLGTEKPYESLLYLIAQAAGISV